MPSDILAYPPNTATEDRISATPSLSKLRHGLRADLSAARQAVSMPRRLSGARATVPSMRMVAMQLRIIRLIQSDIDGMRE